MSTARLREVLNAGHKDKGPPAADGTLSMAADACEAEVTSRRSAVDYVATTSIYLEEDPEGLKPSDLFGKITWRIERFSEVSKRELRSSVFEVGQYKWYILIYPHGCDVCNHLSLFLCVADYDKLLPGWSHFAQFTIAVVNKDPKKSKYSDTLHRFCKKEHDWGWKKFMELTKVLDGFAVNDTLVIKAQVQVIRDTIEHPFRCLDPFYRQDLVRVYLSNVEGVCRRFIEQKREELSSFRSHVEPFKAFWNSLDREMKKGIVTETEDVILKGLVKHFFNEKEVTSTLIMDAIFCGCRQIEEKSRLWLEGSRNRSDAPIVMIDVASGGLFSLGVDVVDVLDSAAYESVGISNKDDKDTDCLRSHYHHSEESIKDSIVRDEHRLAELGRKTVEIFVVSHIFSEHIEITYQYAECLKRQDELLKEEEEDEKKEEMRKKTKAQSDKETRAKRQEKKRAKKEKERKRKEKEDAERQKREDERKRELETKRLEEMERKRMQEEQLERERQQELEKARLRAEKVEREAAERKRALEQTQQLRKSVTAERSQKVRSLSARSKSTPPPQEILKKSQQNAQAAIVGERKLEAKPVRQRSNASAETSVLTKQTEEIKKLQTKIQSLEKQLCEKDTQVQSLQKQVDRLKKREKQLESELSARTSQHAEANNVANRQEKLHSPYTTKTKKSASAKPDSASAGSGDQLQAKTTTVVATKTNGGLDVAPPEVGPSEGRSNTSGDETSSDVTFIEHSRCTSQVLCSQDPSQISDCNTHETRSLSSFGTQLDHNTTESDCMTAHEACRCSRGHEAADSRTHSLSRHGHSHSMALPQQTPLQISAQMYPTQMLNQSRANSAASCIPLRQQSLNVSPAVFPHNPAGRSHSVDAGMCLPDTGPYASGPSYQDYAVHDQFGHLYGSMQHIPSSEFQSPISMQPDTHTMHEGARLNNCNTFDDFAHFSLIKDLLD